MFGHSHEAMIASDSIVLASGTAALEAMLAKQPVVVTYRLSRLTYWLVKRKYLLPYVSLPNIVAGRFLVPELLQDAATAENLAQVVSNYLDDRKLCAALSDQFVNVHEALRCNAAERAAEAVARVLGRA